MAKCNKSREELELERVSHFLLMREFLVSWRIDLACLRAEIYRARVSADG